MSIQNKKVGVVLMTYGSATTALGVREYLEHIRPGKVSPETIAEFERRYQLIGHSPLVEITRAQAAALERELGEGYIVRAGMRHSVPFIDSAVDECHAAGAQQLIGIILAPQFSSFIMEGYEAEFQDAAHAHGFGDDTALVAGPWPAESHFIELLTHQTREALVRLRAEYGRDIPVIFTTHSLPQRVIEKDPSYLSQLQTTIDAVRAQLDPALEWYAGYQSAGHTPEAWLKPDLADILAELHAKKAPAVLIVPIQFLADHLEILYDLDIAAKEQCEKVGIAYHRINLPNTDLLFIRALASVVHEVKFP